MTTISKQKTNQSTEEKDEKIMAICKIPLLIKDIACPARSVK